MTAASVSLGGILGGFTLPRAVAIYNARSVLDCLVRGRRGGGLAHDTQ
ncbi:hypothetical protein [Methylobacterium tarhaniae]|nr:hypothetical protein [Methylobacterium tarhaniae]